MADLIKRRQYAGTEFRVRSSYLLLSGLRGPDDSIELIEEL